MQNGRLYSSTQILQSCFYTLFIFSVSLLFCFSIFCNPGPGSAFGRKRRKKSASEASPAVVWVGKGWRWRYPSPLPSSPIPLLADIYLSYFTPCFAFSPTSEPGPRLMFFWNSNSWNSFRNEFAPQDCCGGGLSGNSLLIIHFIFQFLKTHKSNIFLFSPNFKHLHPKFYTLKTFERASKNIQIIIELIYSIFCFT